jgi:hypothetical protein
MSDISEREKLIQNLLDISPTVKIAPDLTEDELRRAIDLLKFSQAIDKIPENERVPITNPEKYSFPIGIDDDGKPFE